MHSADLVGTCCGHALVLRPMRLQYDVATQSFVAVVAGTPPLREACWTADMRAALLADLGLRGGQLVNVDDVRHRLPQLRAALSRAEVVDA